MNFSKLVAGLDKFLKTQTVQGSNVSQIRTSEGEVWDPSRGGWIAGQTDDALKYENKLFNLQTPPLQVRLPDKNYNLPMKYATPINPQKRKVI